MSGLLRLPPLVTVVILLALAGYVIYRLVASGKVQPLPVILLALLAIILARVLFKMWHKAPADQGEA